VITTAGDAIICTFYGRNPCLYEESDKQGNGANQDMDMERSFLNAFECALRLKDYSLYDLNLHIAISIGEMSFGILGGFKDKWVSVLSGAPLFSIKECLENSKSKEIVISKECDYLVHKHLSAYEFLYMENKNFKFSSKNYAKIESTIMFDREILDETKLNISLLSHFISKPVNKSIVGGYIETMTELRDITTIFISLDSYDIKSETNIELLQPFLHMIQEKCSASGGFVRQFLIDDKGCVAILMWGVPSYSYSNNSFRAISCASLIKLSSRYMNYAISIGIASGNCCCGNIGSSLRQEYVVLGSSVNFASRLMSAAKGRILISFSVLMMLPRSNRELIDEVEMIDPKDSNNTIKVYSIPKNIPIDSILLNDRLELKSIIRKNVSEYINKCINKLAMYQLNDSHKGRDIKRTSITNQQQNLNSIESVNAVFIAAPHCFGKSSVLLYAKHAAQEKNIKLIQLSCMENDETIPFKFIKNLLSKLSFTDDWNNSIVRNYNLLYYCGDLLNHHQTFKCISILNMIFDENGHSSNLSFSEDVDNLLFLVISQIINSFKTFILTVKHSEYIDESSWKVLNLILKRHSNILIIFSILTPLNHDKSLTGVNRDSDHIQYDLNKARFDLSKGLNTSASKHTNFCSKFNFKFNCLNSLLWGSKSKKIQPIMQSSLSRNGIRFYPCEALKEILENKITKFIEITSLSLFEIKFIIGRTLNIKVCEISQELVDIVFQVSAGSPFWCKVNFY